MSNGCMLDLLSLMPSLSCHGEIVAFQTDRKKHQQTQLFCSAPSTS
jgi:hypothetical protein